MLYHNPSHYTGSMRRASGGSSGGGGYWWLNF
jgi:hypothetical protein